METNYEKEKTMNESLTNENKAIKTENQSLENQLAINQLHNTSNTSLSDQEDSVNTIKQLQSELRQSTVMNTDCHLVINKLLVVDFYRFHEKDNVHSLQASLDRTEKRIQDYKTHIVECTSSSK